MATTLNSPISAPTTFTKPTHQTDHNRRIISLTNHCTTTHHLKQLHAQFLRTHLFFDPFLASKLFTASLSPPLSSLDYAVKLFDQMPQPNLYTWNTLIRSYTSDSQPLHALHVFINYLNLSPHPPNNFTFTFVMKAVSSFGWLPLGQAIHGMAVKWSLDNDLFVSNSLLHFYASCGCLDFACSVFDKMGVRDVVSWNSVISGCVQGGCPDKGLEFFERMVKVENLRPDNVTLVAALSACAKVVDVEFGRWVCEYIELNGIEVNLNVHNTMLDFYAKTGSVEEAAVLFDKMEEKDVISWTTMIYGYTRVGDFDSARNVFGAMPHRQIAAWNVLISAYEQNEEPKEALEIFRKLQRCGTAKPDEVTLVSTLSACAQLGAIDIGDWIHTYLKKNNIKLNCHLTASLIDMYSKCGFIKKALEVFHSVEKRDVFVWSSMIAGLAMHGCGRAAIDMFLQMVEAKIMPNPVTFTNLLSACSHAGLVEEGKMFFNQMESVYGVTPEAKHYACMVDILGRAGLLQEAVEFIEKMPISPSTSVWTALLGACRIHGNVQVAEQAYDHLLEIDPTHDGAFVLLSNIYAKTGKWDRVSGLRQHMKNSGIKKEPGCSSIEVKGTIHEFFAGDNSHPLSKEIYMKLDEIVSWLKSTGYMQNKSHVLQCVEEEDMQEHALNLHSEKLAIAFGLITLDQSQPIRIMKNLRICGDCHSVAKNISKLYGRDIILRDRYRFHHFSDGHCSCMDYW